MAKSRDLFDDTTMSFGEHLEVLRIHVWRALIGLVIGIAVCLIYGDRVISIVRTPIDNALIEYGLAETAQDDVGGFNFIDWVKSWFSEEENAEETDEKLPKETILTSDSETNSPAIRVEMPVDDLVRALREAAPELIRSPEEFPANNADNVMTNNEPSDDVAASDPPETTTDGKEVEEPRISITLFAPEFAQFRKATKDVYKPVTLNVQEAFLTYLKVSVVAGFVVASPWIFYQLWLFVAAGLYAHERKYIYIYLPISLGLFLAGTIFCFYAVFPLVLQFLLGFNRLIGVTPQIRLSEWISFAIMLPLMFGVSFQLPLVMLFMQRISIFEVETYRTRRRMSILIIAIVSMLLTPSDPGSMLLMMIPLVVLYEVGIWMCELMPSGQANPFAAET